MTLPYKVYTVCRRALEDVYLSKGGSLRTGGDFRCFHLDVAGFYRLLEMMVAFGRVVDQVAEFEAFHLFPVLSVVADPDDTGYRALTALFLRGEGKAAYRLLAAEVDGEGLRGLVGYLPSLLDQPEPFLQDSSLFSVQDGYRFQFAVSHQERCFIFGRACRWFRSVCRIVDLETCVQVLGNVLAVRFPAEFLCHRFDGNQAVHASLCAQPGRTGFVVVGGDGADGGCQAGFEYADPYLCLLYTSDAADE